MHTAWHCDFKVTALYRDVSLVTQLSQSSGFLPVNAEHILSGHICQQPIYRNIYAINLTLTIADEGQQCRITI